MDPVAVAAFVLGGVIIGGIVWLVMRQVRLEEKLVELHLAQSDTAGKLTAAYTASDDAQRSERRALADLAREQAANAKLQSELDDARRRIWPESLNLDKRVWAANIAALQETSANDALDALQRMSPEAARRVISKFAPHLYGPEGEAMTVQSQEAVEKLVEHARRHAAGYTDQPVAQPAAATQPARRAEHLGPFIALLVCIAVWLLAIWCSVNGYGPHFVLGFCLLTAGLVLWVRRPGRKKPGR